MERKRGPAWSALSVRSCERARMRLHRGGWCSAATTANCSSAEESEAIPLPFVHIGQSLTRCAPIAFPLYLSLFSACGVFIAGARASVRNVCGPSRRNIRLSARIGPIANLRFCTCSSMDAIACWSLS